MAGEESGPLLHSGPPHADVTNLDDGPLLCGLGGLSAESIGELLRQHCVVRAIVCGRPGRDRHVEALQSAMSAVGLGRDALHIVPIADNSGEDLLGHLEASSTFINASTDAATKVSPE